MNTENNLYDGDDSSGLLNHYVGRVKRSFWSTMFAETNGQANQDFAHTTMLFWQNDVLDILQANYSASGPPTESNLASFGIGNGWMATAENPDLLYHEDDSEEDGLKLFHSNTALMRFVHIVSGRNSTYEGAIVLDGDGDFTVDLGGARAIHAQKGVKTLRDATIWENMIFEFRGLGFPNRRNPKPGPKTTPVRFLGYDDSETPSVPTVGQPSAAASAKGQGELPAEAREAFVAGGVPEDKLPALTKLWGSAANPEAFEKQALMLLRNDADAAAAVTAYVHQEAE